MGLFAIFKRNKRDSSPEARRRRLLAEGRLTDAVICDVETSENGAQMARFTYNIQGVDFESSEPLTPEQVQDISNYAPGSGVLIRYDPRNHYNAVIV
ncbi:MAG: hypothetical protein ACK5NT_01530 [Pyrinomonadaceae bacterium]